MSVCSVINLSVNRQLESEGLVSRQDVDDLNNGLVSAQAALKAMRLQIDKTMPSAPIAGIVDHIFVDRGEYVDPGKPLIRLLQVERLKAIADVPEKDVALSCTRPGSGTCSVQLRFQKRAVQRDNRLYCLCRQMKRAGPTGPSFQSVTMPGCCVRE